MASTPNPRLREILAGLNGLQQSQNQYAQPDTSLSVIPGLDMNRPRPAIPAKPFNPPKIVVTTPRPSTPIPDASTIVTWPSAIRYVTKYIANNESAAARIKHLIAQQHQHEREWWTGREAIVKRHSGRAQRQAQAATLLKAIGGVVAANPPSEDPEVDRRELEVYDRKVYGELRKMSADFDRQLRGLGVPLFAIRHELVVDRDMDGGAGGRLTKEELKELQRRVLEHLVDLFGE